MLEVFDLNRKKVAILQNAYNIIEKEEINTVNTLTFSLPADDDKNQYCNPYWYVRYNDGQLYRIISPSGQKNDTGIKNYECEHVIATLIDDVLFGAHIVGNIGVFTNDSINYVLSKQTKQNWVLGECDFSRQFEYGWENENLLAALFSISNRFTEPYIWKFDTSSYPWIVHLKKIYSDGIPQYFIRSGKNLLDSNYSITSAEICTRLYCLGYGEGINQLTISDVNNGLPYLQSPQEYINKYGLISRIWVDRRFEDAQSLKEQGEAILKGLQEPQKSITVSVADLYQMTEADYDKAEIGRMALLVDEDIKTYITGITRNYDNVGDMQITLSTKAVDIAKTVADLADRQRIEQVYSQGATQLYGQSIQANATPQIGAVLNFWIPEEMRIINKVLAKITFSRFRSYSRATKGGGATTTTSSSGGGSQTTSSSGGGSQSTTSSGGGTNTSTSSGGGSYSTGSFETLTTSTLTNLPNDPGGPGWQNHNHGIPRGVWIATYSGLDQISGYVQFEPSGAHMHPAHTHSFTLQAHTHNVNIQNHTHSVDIKAHTHSVEIKAHTHDITLPDHTHDIEQGIFEFGNARTAKILINGVEKGTMNTDYDVDLTEWLAGEDKKIKRGQWQSITVVPNDLAYVTIDLYIQGFVQSRGDNTY